MSEAGKILSTELAGCSNFTTKGVPTKVSKLSYDYKTFSPTRFKCYNMIPRGEELWGIPPEVHFISDTRVVWNPPLVEVKDEFKDFISIRFTENLGHHVVPSAMIDFDANGSFTTSPIESDIKRAFMMKNGGRLRYDHDIGNHSKCSKWTTVLARYPLMIKQGWFFSGDCASSIPCMGDDTKIIFKIKTETDISKLVMMREKTESGYKYFKCDKKYLNISGVEKPKIFCLGSSVGAQELEFYKNNGKTIYLHDMKVISDSTPRALGDKFVVPINSSAPVKAIFWVARNLAAFVLNNKSNYTTNVADSGKGWNPCYASGTIPSNYINSRGNYVDISPFYFHDRGMAIEGFPSSPDKLGFNVCPLCDCLSVDMEDAVDINGITSCGVTVTLGDTDPRKISDFSGEVVEFREGVGISKSSGIEKEKFEVFVVLLTAKKLTAKWDATRNKLNYSITG